MAKVCLASDNFSSAHPSIVHAIQQANQGYAPSYGSDEHTAEAIHLMHKAFKRSPKVLIVPTGTMANVIALKLACRRHESVICTDIAHIHYQECGAAESIAGCKLLPVPSTEGKIFPVEVQYKLKKERAFGKHSTLPRVLSITQPTETGTVYSLNELEALAKLCKDEGLLMHMDGCRIFNAAVHLGCSLDAIAEAAQVDLLSFGGTKNGLACAESLLIFNDSLKDGADHLHKQNMGLISKLRYVSCQYIPFLKSKLWHELAAQANARAQEVATIIQATPHLSLSYPVQTNQIFFTAPKDWIPEILDQIFCYVWDSEKHEIRFITSWNTPEKDVESVRRVFSKLSKCG